MIRTKKLRTTHVESHVFIVTEQEIFVREICAERLLLSSLKNEYLVGKFFTLDIMK